MAIGNVAVTTRLLAQLSVIIFAGFLLAGCQSKEGDIETADAADFFPDPLPLGLPVYKTIDEPFFGVNSEGASVLYSYDTDAALVPEDPDNPDAVSNPNPIFTSNDNVVLTLDTVADDASMPEISILVSEDSVYKVDHANNEIRLLAHFSTHVCEVIPVDLVETTSQNNNTDVEHTVVNANWVYIMTSESNDPDDCIRDSATKRYYQLALNYKLNASDVERCVAEGGLNTDVSECKTNLLPVVSESIARAQLVFGWVDDEVTASPDDKRLTYGYLSYGFKEQKLRFFDEQRQELWSQDRAIQAFSTEAVGSREYIAQLTVLYNAQYLLQLGRDVFVFDSSSELFAKDFSDVDTVLTDRNYQLDSQLGSGGEVIDFGVYRFDAEELVILDGAKILRFDYATSYVAPISSRNFSVTGDVIPITGLNFFGARLFSQFDQQSCSSLTDAGDIALCQEAHDVASDDWQFITDCTVDVGCAFEVDNNDYCTNPAEFEANPTLTNLCTPSDYRHLNELDGLANNAEFRGFMQYGESIRELDSTLITAGGGDDALYLLAHMKEKDVLLKYFYNAELADPKPSREQVLFGERAEHFGMEVRFNDANLFATTLQEKSVLSNVCYKNRQRVTCDLGEFDQGGGNTVCTGLDLQQGLCSDRFIEYSSSALFCTSAMIAAGQCTDDQVMPNNTLAVEGADQDAKWLPILDWSQTGDPEFSMHVLLADADAEVVVDGNVVPDEGVLVTPEIFAVDDATGAVGGSLGVVDGNVENPWSGWIRDSLLGRLDMVSQDVVQTGGAPLASQQYALDQYYLSDPLSGNGQATKVHSAQVGR